jgi:hypothetical protein
VENVASGLEYFRSLGLRVIQIGTDATLNCIGKSRRRNVNHRTIRSVFCLKVLKLTVFLKIECSGSKLYQLFDCFSHFFWLFRKFWNSFNEIQWENLLSTCYNYDHGAGGAMFEGRDWFRRPVFVWTNIVFPASAGSIVRIVKYGFISYVFCFPLQDLEFDTLRYLLLLLLLAFPDLLFESVENLSCGWVI